jgi:EAL domain-containing protein (putative c-di-GMP-specific phosphodiesterase class I)/FixJ family two-component response regulator
MYAPDNSGRPAVLIVEDDPVQLRVLTAMTRRLGVASLPASSVEEARAVLRTNEIRTVLLDLQLGEEAGLDILRNLSNDAPPCSVVFISGCDERTRTAASRLAHAQGVHVAGSLSKPIRMDELASLLESTSACAWQPTPKQRPRVTPVELIGALAGNQITAEFQPKVSLADRRAIGVEALARWRSPMYGNVSPDIFIPLAEECGKLRALTEVVLRVSLQACARWRGQFPDVSVAVNVAPSLVDYGLVELVGKLLDETKVPAKSLVLEITESSMIGDSLSVSDVLTRLRISGVQLSIDDFGTGYSSLVSLLRMPFNELKLDRLFVACATRDNDAARILRSLIVLSRELGLRSVAEGIETEEVSDRLREFGCDSGQGWLWSAALKESDLVPWLAAHSIRNQRTDLLHANSLRQVSGSSPFSLAVPTSW